MDAIVSKTYLCSPRVLLPGILRGRDGWKIKTRALRTTVKNLKRRVADVSESRDGWKSRARSAEATLTKSQQQIARLQAEQETLQRALVEAREKKRQRQGTC